MGVRAVDFVGIPVRDMEAAKIFYGDVLGLPAAAAFGGRWAEYDAGNVTLAVIQVDASEWTGQSSGSWQTRVAVALAVTDVKATIAELEKKGVKVTSEVQDFPPCYMAMVEDPDGNSVFLHQRKDGTAG
jgi:predicted enzyme related to lactoylglutathione lyase